MIISKNVLLNELKRHYKDHYFINRIDIYRHVVFCELKTPSLHCAVEISEDSSIELVFRNETSRIKFSEFFGFNFMTGNRLHPTLELDSVFSIKSKKLENNHDLLWYLDEIFGACIRVEKDILSRLSAIEKSLCQINNSTLLSLRNQVFLNMGEFMAERLLSMKETLMKISQDKLSIARIVDGEITLLTTRRSLAFQKSNWSLTQELQDICQQDNSNSLLVCMPGLMIENPWWTEYWTKHWYQCKFLLSKQCILGDSFITRPEAFYKYGNAMVNLWKDLWDGKKACFVTGISSKMNVGHFMFDNLSDSKHIYSLPANAYDEINELVEKCIASSDIDVFLIALGPTGTVLASRLAKLGYWALDIGHLNNSYDTVFNNMPTPEKL